MRLARDLVAFRCRSVSVEWELVDGRILLLHRQLLHWHRYSSHPVYCRQRWVAWIELSVSPHGTARHTVLPRDAPHRMYQQLRLLLLLLVRRYRWHSLTHSHAARFMQLVAYPSLRLWDDSCSPFDGCIRTIFALSAGKTEEWIPRMLFCWLILAANKWLEVQSKLTISPVSYTHLTLPTNREV